METSKTIKLFSKSQVGLATFFGGALAGAMLMSLNDMALGQTKTAKQTVVIGVAATLALTVLVFFLPVSVPKIAIAFAVCMGVQQWYLARQQATFETHVAEGGRKGSWLIAIAVAVLALLTAMVLLIGIAMVVPASMLK